MSDEASQSSTPEPNDPLAPQGVAGGVPQSGTDDLPDDLPPVQPPSAGFIVQLFLVPGLIVLVVVGVWALFGRMASSEQNWQVLVEELKQPNQHRRWRGAMGLAQLLASDQRRGDDGDGLTTNPQVAKALTDLLREELDSKTNDEANLKQQAFLARTLGLLDVPEVVLPTLQRAMNPKTDASERMELRKNAVGAVAVIAGRAAERDKADGSTYPGKRLTKLCEFPSLVDDLMDVSNNEEPLIRQIGTFTLGLFPTQASRDRLEALLGHSDDKTRVNAAVALARQKSTKGMPVFKAQFAAAAKKPVAELITPEERTAGRFFWVGVSAATFLLTAVWAFGTTQRSSRMVASMLCVASIIGLSWGIYDLTKNSPTEAPADVAVDNTADSQETLQERRQQARALRFERVIVLQNLLKAVTELGPEFNAGERSELLALIEPIAEQKNIRIDAAKAMRSLKEPAPDK